MWEQGRVNATLFLIPRFVSRRSHTMEATYYYTTFSDALAQLRARREDRELRRRVELFLGTDVPDPFREGPVLYLARHVATPNFESLFFLDMASRMEWTAVIGQDLDDKFVPKNSLKRALGKLPIVRGNTIGGERTEYITVLDFNKSNGRSLRELATFRGTPLGQFHNELFQHVVKEPVYLSDESAWITIHHRGNLLEHYKKHFALFILHGILFEYFVTCDTEENRLFVDVVEPAFHFVLEHFGVRPLIVPSVTPSIESNRNWEAYPEGVYGYVRGQQCSYVMP